MLLVLGPHFENQWFRLMRIHSDDWAQLLGSAPPHRGGRVHNQSQDSIRKEQGEKTAGSAISGDCYRVSKEQSGRG